MNRNRTPTSMPRLPRFTLDAEYSNVKCKCNDNHLGYVATWCRCKPPLTTIGRRFNLGFCVFRREFFCRPRDYHYHCHYQMGVEIIVPIGVVDW